MEMLYSLAKYALMIGGISTAAIFIAKQIFRSFLDGLLNMQKHELEKQRDIHKNILDKANTEFKSQLDLVLKKSSTVYDKRMEVIQGVYSRIVSLDDDVKYLTRMLKTHVKDEKEKAEIDQKELEAAARSFNDFSIYYRQNKLFLPIEISALLDETIILFHDVLFTHDQARNPMYGLKFQYELFAKNREKINKEVPVILERIEKLFKNLLSLNEKQFD